MKAICAWCGKEILPKPCAPGQEHLVSHGICGDCFELLSEETP